MSLSKEICAEDSDRNTAEKEKEQSYAAHVDFSFGADSKSPMAHL